MLLEQKSEFESSMVENAFYNYTNKTLNVTFKGGQIYKYENVPNKLYEDFCKSDSQGKFLNEKIKGNFEYSQLLND